MLALGEVGVGANELQVAGVEAAMSFSKKEPAEQPREHAHGQEEARPAGDPALTVGRDAAARHDHVNVRMMGQRRSPGVQNGLCRCGRPGVWDRPRS